MNKEIEKLTKEMNEIKILTTINTTLLVLFFSVLLGMLGRKAGLL